MYRSGTICFFCSHKLAVIGSPKYRNYYHTAPLLNACHYYRAVQTALFLSFPVHALDTESFGFAMLLATQWLLSCRLVNRSFYIT